MKNILTNIAKNKGCWDWLGEINKKGYGRLEYNGKRIKAHRYFYEYFVKPIPNGLEIDHLCRNKRCVNPKHLEAVTHRENIIRAWRERIKDIPNCLYGHPYSGNNLYMIIEKKNGKTWRACKTCKLEANRRWRKRIATS